MAFSRKKKTRKRKKNISLNTILWFLVVTFTIIYTLFNFGAIKALFSRFYLSESVIEETKIKEKQPTLQKEDSLKKDNNFNNNRANNQEYDFDNTDSNSNNNSSADESNDKNNTSTIDDSSVRKDVSTISIVVYFVKMNNNGTFSMIPRKRNIKKTNAVLLNTLKELFKGPSKEERSSNVRSFIPSGSSIYSVYIKNKTAYLNFNDIFQFNPEGPLASTAQLFQIVYTSMEFPTINKVQILIEGKPVSFLSGDSGISIKNPIDKIFLKSKL